MADRRIQRTYRIKLDTEWHRFDDETSKCRGQTQRVAGSFPKLSFSSFFFSFLPTFSFYVGFGLNCRGPPIGGTREQTTRLTSDLNGLTRRSRNSPTATTDFFLIFSDFLVHFCCCCCCCCCCWAGRGWGRGGGKGGRERERRSRNLKNDKKINSNEWKQQVYYKEGG